ncbi:MAG: gamma-glutamyl-gamma-aminobutyrate hydrolase family protein [archaeon]
MILIINTCAEKLHYLEFVKPIEDIVKKDFTTKHYNDLTEDDLNNADKIIVCGTSLKDNKFLKGNFDWIKNIDKPILGICAGMQIIGTVLGGKLKQGTEIGFYDEEFKEFLGIKGKEQVYHLHNNYLDKDSLKGFEILSKGKTPQAVRQGNIYGVLFHPEVRQKEMILRFIEN